MHKKLVIIGAGGHGKVVADIAEELHKYETIIFFDDNTTEKECMGYPIVGTSACIREYIKEAEFIVAIGNSKVREKVLNQLKTMQADITTLIHPLAVVSKHTTIGKGTVVMAGTVINPNSVIGTGCIINTSASVDHDCEIGGCVHIAVGAHVAGTCVIGERTWIGAGATVSNNVDICNDCMIGAGTVVVKNIDEPGIYVGIPAKRASK